MRPILGAVHHDGVAGDAEVIQFLQQLTHNFVVLDHHVMIVRLPAAGPAFKLGLDMGAQMHMRGVEPDEERNAGLDLALQEVIRFGEDLIVDSLHSLFVKRTGVMNRLRAVVIGPTVKHAPRTLELPEVRKVRGRRVVWQFRLLQRVQVVQKAEELVNSMVGKSSSLSPKWFLPNCSVAYRYFSSSAMVGSSGRSPKSAPALPPYSNLCERHSGP